MLTALPKFNPASNPPVPYWTKVISPHSICLAKQRVTYYPEPLNFLNKYYLIFNKNLPGIPRDRTIDPISRKKKTDNRNRSTCDPDIGNTGKKGYDYV